jgi:hypothetical protein
VAIVAQAAITPLYAVTDWLNYVTGREDANIYYDRFAVGITDPSEERAVASYIRARTRPDESIGMWAINTAVPYLADRASASRFIERRIFTIAPDHPITRAYRREFVAEIAARRPTYFVVNRRVDPWDQPAAQAFPELAGLVADWYVHDTTFGGLEVLRRRPALAGAAGVGGGRP